MLSYEICYISFFLVSSLLILAHHLSPLFTLAFPILLLLASFHFYFSVFIYSWLLSLFLFSSLLDVVQDLFLFSSYLFSFCPTSSHLFTFRMVFSILVSSCFSLLCLCSVCLVVFFLQCFFSSWISFSILSLSSLFTLVFLFHCFLPLLISSRLFSSSIFSPHLFLSLLSLSLFLSEMLSKTLLTLSCLFSCLIYSRLILHCLFSTHLASSHIFSSHFTWSRLASSPPFSWCFFSPWLIFSLFLLHLIWPLLFLYVLTSSLSFFGDVIQLLFLFSSCLISSLFHLLSLKFYPRLFSSFFRLFSLFHLFSITLSGLYSSCLFSHLFISIYLFSSFLVSSFLTTFLLILVHLFFLSHLFSFHSDFSCFTASLLISSGLFCSHMFSHFPFLFLSQSFSEMLSNICSSTHYVSSHLIWMFSSCPGSCFLILSILHLFLSWLVCSHIFLPCLSPCLFSPFLVQSHLLLWSVYNNTTTLLNHFPVTTDVFEVSLILLVIIYLMWDALLEQTVVLLFFYPSFDASRSLLLTCLPSICCIMLHLCAFVLFSLSLISYFSLYRYLAFPLLSLSLHLPSCGPSWRAFWRFSAGGKAFWKATKGFKNKFGIFLILMRPWIFPSQTAYCTLHVCGCVRCFSVHGCGLKFNFMF